MDQNISRDKTENGLIYPLHDIILIIYQTPQNKEENILLHIDVAAPEESETIAVLANIIWREHYLPIIGLAQVEYMLKNLQSKEQIKNDMLEKGYTYYLVKDETHGYIGYASIRLDPEELFISKLYILAAFRGQKIGNQLLNTLLDVARAQGKSAAFLTVNKYNSLALAVYNAWGFITAESIKSDIGGGFIMDDYIMRKKF